MTEQSTDRRGNAFIFLALSIVLSLGGVAGFVVLFVRDFNVYWLILTPVILAVYQIPAVFFFWLYKRRRLRRGENPGHDAGAPGSGLV